jgi:transcriptional regulator
MYVPAQFSMDEAATRRFLADRDTADLVTLTNRGLVATFLPILYEPAPGGYGSVVGHVARANEQWRLPALHDALMIVHGPDAYISPSWYPSKAVDGRVVPTWDYGIAHVYGRLVVHDDPAWLEALVRRLTARHEGRTPRPWSVDDAPAPYLAGQLRAIVGVEVAIGRVEAKAKWSQNRPVDDIDGVVTGLGAAGHDKAAEAVRAGRRGPAASGAI